MIFREPTTSNNFPFAAIIMFTIMAIATFGLTTPAAAGPDDHPTVLPLGPDTQTFDLHIAKDAWCESHVAERHGSESTRPTLYATNTVDDPCAIEGTTTAAAKSLVSSDATLRFRVLTDTDQTIELVQDDPITADIWLWTEQAGTLGPRFVLRTPDGNHSADHGPAQISTVSATADEDGRVWYQYNVALGKAPANFTSGQIWFDVTLDNEDTDIRALGVPRFGIGTSGDHASTLTLPFAEQIDEPDPPVEEPPLPWPPALADANVRPGVAHTTNGAQCTTNFVFRDRTTDKLYMGTAAHCVAGINIGGTSQIGTYGGGPGISSTLAWSSWRESGSVRNADFALLEIRADDEHRVHPAVIHFGGPTQLADMSRVGSLDKVITFGNSGLRPGPEQLDWHEGYVTGESTWYTSVYTITPGIFGDSGSGIMTRDGGALGAASTIEIFPVTGRNHFSNIPPVIDWMNDNGWDLELQTWELLDPGFLPGPFG